MVPPMLSRQRTGSTLCPSCGKLVGVNDDVCLNCGRRRPGMWGLTSVVRNLGKDAGFFQLVIAGNVFLYLAMLAVDPQHIQMGGLFSLGGPSQASLLRFGASGALPVFILHRWWTVLSAGWLHAGLLHIGFNLYWIRILAPETAELYGPGRMVMLYTAASIGGFAASSVMQQLGVGGLVTVGASAPILGLLGAMVAYSRRTGSGVVGWTTRLTWAASRPVSWPATSWTRASRRRATTSWGPSSVSWPPWPPWWLRWWCRSGSNLRARPPALSPAAAPGRPGWSPGS
jgi:rhomboid protease GluP